MRTFSSELVPYLDASPTPPRVYADANVPAPIVDFMRHRLGWDVFFVLEEEELRRAPDLEHFRLARQLHRTLVTQDRDYLDDRQFPPGHTAGILIMTAPDERALMKLLRRVDVMLFTRSGPGSVALPLKGRKLHAQIDWTGEADPGPPA